LIKEGLSLNNLGRIAFTIIFTLLLTSCSSNDESQILKPILIASEKSLPHSFEQIAENHGGKQFNVERVSTIEALREMWNNFKFDSELVEVDMTTTDVLFIGLYESSSCPYNIQDIIAEDNKNELVVKLDVNNNNCTADQSPRNFVLTIDKTMEVTTLVIVDGSKEVPVRINNN